MNQFQMNQGGQLGKTVLFISELPENILDSDLETFFSEYKDYILMIQLDRNGRMMDPYSGVNPKATIIFKDHLKAEEARNKLNMNKMKGKTLNIMWHEKDNTIRYNNRANLFVKCIPFNVKPREIYEVFIQFGEIISSKLCEDEDGNHLGYGYINYYSYESAEKAISSLNKKELWGSIIEVEHFQKKNERIQSLLRHTTLYIKNFPIQYTDADLMTLFEKYGKVEYIKVEQDVNQRKYAILEFNTEEAANKAKEGLNNLNMKGMNEPLFVDFLQKKNDRKRFLSSKISDNNNRLNDELKNCNLHIKNLPNDISEETLLKIFSKYGEIKSVKIPKYILVTMVKNEKKEIEQNRGFGYVCFTNPENAQNAKDELNDKNLPGYEQSKRPLIINYFMPKIERKQFLSKLQGNSMSRFPMVVNSYQMNPNINPYRVQGNYQKRRNPPQYIQKQQNPNQAQVPKVDQPDMNYLNSLEDNEAKKEYMGEFLFKQIANHPIAQQRNFTIDVLGRITGMILGIEDINEIYETIVNPDSLTARINEALSLIDGQSG